MPADGFSPPVRSKAPKVIQAFWPAVSVRAEVELLVVHLLEHEQVVEVVLVD